MKKKNSLKHYYNQMRNASKYLNKNFQKLRKETYFQQTWNICVPTDAEERYAVKLFCKT